MEFPKKGEGEANPDFLGEFSREFRLQEIVEIENESGTMHSEHN